MDTVPQTPASALLNAHEVSKATDYLESTRDGILRIVGDLSDAQWNFKPEADLWSIAEILDHLAIIEGRVHGIVARMPDEPVAEPGRTNSQVEAIIIAEVPDRSIKFKAPPVVCPSQQVNHQESLARFLKSRARTVELLREAPYLRGHVFSHPILGPWDGYQWILAAAAHCARHTEQILELKACAGFPEAPLISSVSLN